MGFAFRRSLQNCGRSEWGFLLQVCDESLLFNAIRLWRDDPAVRLPPEELNKRFSDEA